MRKKIALPAFDKGKVAPAADRGPAPVHLLNEVLAFPAPPAEAGDLQLELPADGFGVAARFRFRIPRGMIQDG